MEIWLTFVLATTLILTIPGPTIILVISQSVAHGKQSTLPLVAGVLLGDFTAMTTSLLGLGALMATSAIMFSIFKWVGALYLIYLGTKLLISKSNNTDQEASQTVHKSSKSLFRSSFIVTALNPKSIGFFVAFLPQFIEPSKAVFSQFVLFGGTFLILATVNAAIYSVFAIQLKQNIEKPLVKKWFNRCGGSALIGTGVITASMT